MEQINGFMVDDKLPWKRP